jgi:hypothetical protein
MICAVSIRSSHVCGPLVLLEQVLPVVHELRVGKVGQRDQLAVDGVRLDVRLQVRRQDLRLVGAEVRVERLGPLRGCPLRRSDDVDQHDVEHRVLRRQHRVQVLLLRLRRRAADLDLDLHVRVALLVFVGDLAHDVGPLLAAGEDAQRRLGLRGGAREERRDAEQRDGQGSEQCSAMHGGSSCGS